MIFRNPSYLIVKPKERERRGEGEGSSPRGPKSGDRRLQILGHHGERDRGGEGRGRLLRGGNQMRERNQGEGRARMGVGARGLDWAGLGHIADRNPRHARPLNGLQSQTENRNGTRRTRDIRQRNALRHDATPMTLRFCLYMTRTLVTILV